MKYKIFVLLVLVMALMVACTPQVPQLATTAPTTQPTAAPTTQATTRPSTQPTTAPTTQPTTAATTLPTVPPSGWMQVEGETVYQDGGVCRTGWQVIDGKRYYFDANGYMQIGFLELKEGTYYLDKNGNPVTGEMTLNGETYLFNKDGTAYTGFRTSGTSTYYHFSNGMMAKGEVKVDGKSYFFTSQGKRITVVNGDNPISTSSTPALVTWRGRQLKENAMAAVKAMILDGEAKGYQFSFNSGYRSKASQQRIWDKRYNEYISQGLSPKIAEQKVAMSVARPGESEHHTGMAADIDGTWESLAWMAENSWRYGLILRYPDGKTDITGVIYEPWHFRYVGKAVAKEIYELDMCLEEYIDMLTRQQGRKV